MNHFKSESFQLAVAHSTELIDLDCHYVKHDDTRVYDNLYIAPRLSDGTSDCRTENSELTKSTAAGSLLCDTGIAKTGSVVVFQIPKRDCYVAYADPWSPRVADCELVAATRSFVCACDGIKGYTFSSLNAGEVVRALNASVGAVVFDLPMSKSSVDTMELELSRRLNFPWLSDEPVQHRRVCFLYNGALNITATRDRWEKAMALGIKVVIMSSGDWWADENGPYAHLRDGFISIDMQPDSGLSQRIADGVRAYPEPIDGIFAISDSLLVPVAEAAKELGLWTNGPEPYRVATNKYLTRCLANPEAMSCFKVESVHALHARMESGAPVDFPVVCKPVSGRGSEGVYRADNTIQLDEAVAQALASKNGDIIIEPYVSGPEVDCNLVLLEGRILYSDVVDDFPSPADTAPDARGKMFTETEAVAPSRLPQPEQDAIIRSVHQTVILQGFHTGIFHCEARVMNSSMDFVYPEDGSIPELEMKKKPAVETNDTPRIFLHEINARIPGVASSYSSLLAQGVDFWALQMLCALGDWSRYEAFATPFGAGSHVEHVWLTNAMAEVTLKGLKPAFPDIPEEEMDHKLVGANCNPVDGLAATHGHLTGYILSHSGFVKDGVKYGRRPGEWLWFACMVIRSPISRDHARNVAQEMQIAYRDFVRDKYYI